MMMKMNWREGISLSKLKCSSSGKERKKRSSTIMMNERVGIMKIYR